MPNAELPQSPAGGAIVIELLGLIGCGELFAFETLAADVATTDNLRIKAALAERACREFGNYLQVVERLRGLGADPDEVIGAYVPTMTEFHRKTAPKDLPEGLIKAYVGDGISSDFGREISAYVDPETRGFVRRLLSDPGQAEFVVPFVGEVLDQDPGCAGRLALWGRRLMGEALAQAQRVAADRPELAVLVVGDPGAPGQGDLAELARMLTRLTEAHSERMRKLGLAP